MKTVIALVEYLTSEEAGQSLSSRFAWPVGYIITGKSAAKVNGGTNGHANGNGSLKKTLEGSASGFTVNSMMVRRLYRIGI